MTKQNKMAKWMSLFLAAGLALGFSSGSYAAYTKPTNKELKIGINSEYETLHPSLVSSVGGAYILTLAWRKPIFLSPAPENIYKTNYIKEMPSLEKKTAKFVTKNGVKGIEATFEILEKAKWGDGAPMTCADIKLDWEVKIHPNVSYANKEPYLNIEEISWQEKTPKKCKIVFKKAEWDFYQNIPFAIPNHLEREIFEKNKGQQEAYERNSLYTKQPTTPGLWNGPYLISEVALGSHVAFTPNAHYYGKKPSIQKIIFKIIPNAATLEANLRSGNIDMISQVGLSIDQALGFDEKIKSEKLPYKIQFVDGTIFSHFDINLKNNILSEIKVRKAISHAINKAEIVKSIYVGRASVADQWLTPSDPWYPKDKKWITRYAYDRKKAKALLDEAGWKLGPDGVRMKDGKKLTINLVGAAGLKLIENIQMVVQSQLKEIGIELTTRVEPSRLFFSETLPKGRFDMALFSWSSVPENSPESTFSSKNIPTEKNTWTGQNYPGWSNPKVDENIDKLKTEFSSSRRKELIAEIVKMYTDEIPVLPLAFRNDNAVIPTNMTGFKLTGHQFYDTNQVENWNLE